jgi:thioredoxin reductase (NADPH)
MSNIATMVHVIHRREKFRAEAVLIDKLMSRVQSGKVILHLNQTVQEVLGDDSGVAGVRLRSVTSGTESRLDVKACFVAIGHEPNTGLFREQLAMDGGYLVTRAGNAEFATMTSVQGVFAAGDVQDSVYRQAVTSAGTGCMAALDAQRYLEQFPV